MSNILRFAGTWNSTTTYYNDFVVISPINNQAYVFYGISITGGADPSTNPAWAVAPSGGGGLGPTGPTGATGGGVGGGGGIGADGGGRSWGHTAPL